MRNVLWVGDAGCDSGFEKSTRHITNRLPFRVSILGLNFLGDPEARERYVAGDRLYPCWPGGDMFGVKRLVDIVNKTKPDVIVFQNDPWNIGSYMDQLDKLTNRPKTIGFIAVDGQNCYTKDLNRLDHNIFWTQFGRDEAVKGGLVTSTGITPLGVDLDQFQPIRKLDARRALGLPKAAENGFIVGNINRNQPRKRLDLTIRYFAKWVHSRKVKDAWLYLHVCPTGDVGISVDQLGEYYGINTTQNQRLIVAEPSTFEGVPESWIARTMAAFDVGFTTAQAEGMGLPALEMMAMGIPCVLAHSL